MRPPLNLGPNHLPFASCAEHLKLRMFVAHSSLLRSNGLGNKLTSLFLRVRSRPEAEPVFLPRIRAPVCAAVSGPARPDVTGSTSTYPVVPVTLLSRSKEFTETKHSPNHGVSEPLLTASFITESLKDWESCIHNGKLLETTGDVYWSVCTLKVMILILLPTAFHGPQFLKIFFKVLIHEWLNRSETLPQSVN